MMMRIAEQREFEVFLSNSPDKFFERQQKKGRKKKGRNKDYEQIDAVMRERERRLDELRQCCDPHVLEQQQQTAAAVALPRDLIEDHHVRKGHGRRRPLAALFARRRPPRAHDEAAEEAMTIERASSMATAVSVCEEPSFANMPPLPPPPSLTPRAEDDAARIAE